MARAFCIPGIVLITAALALSLLVSISLPFLTALDVTRVHFDTSPSTAGSSKAISQIRFGVWSACSDNAQSGSRDCLPKHHGYQIQVESPADHTIVTIGSSWTRGLAIHPVATALTFLAFCFSFSEHVTVTLVSSLLAFLAAFLTLIAFCVDIALLAFVKHEMGKLSGVRSNTNTGPGFWLTFVSLILLLLSGCTVCFGRRRARMSGANSYQMSQSRPFWQRFRRN